MKKTPEKPKNIERSSITVKARVVADASRELVVEKEKGLMVSVKEPAEMNRANNRVRILLAKKYGVPLKKVLLVRGHHAPSKTFSILL
ncbi:MAG: DUF167 domain-containing protein [Candidatus Adlerbacteria bacterium]